MFLIGGVMFSEARLRDKYSHYVACCNAEEMDPAKIMDFEQYCEVYLEVLYCESEEISQI